MVWRLSLPAPLVLLLRRRTTFWLVVALALLNLGHWVLLALTVPATEESVVLHYNVYFGIDRVGYWREAFLAPLTVSALSLLDTVGATWLLRRDQLLAGALLVAAVFMAALALLVSLLVRLRFA